jgi:hypothetical protein
MRKCTVPATLVSTTLAMLFTASASGAALDSSAFNHQYNGDVVPVPNYTVNAPFNAAPSTDGDIMSYRVSQGGGYLSADDWSVNHATGFTIEFRVKIDEDFPEASKGAVALYYGDGSAGDVLSVGAHSVWNGVGAVQDDANTNSDGYHVFRVAQAGGTPTPISIYRDGVLLRQWPNGGNFGSNVLFFGAGGSSFGGPTVHVDYLRWDNTGAYTPEVPEPASMGLLGVMGTALLSRRRARG